jgi:hypothetical protein
MPEPASRLDTALYDQFQDDHPVADWGGDDLFTRMPRPRAVDDAPAPRFRPALALVDPPQEPRFAPSAEASGAPRRRLSVVEDDRPASLEETVRRWDALLEPSQERASNGRRTTVITGRPDGTPRPLAVLPAEQRRRTPVDWIGPQPERMVAWVFALGLLLVLIAVFTA